MTTTHTPGPWNFTAHEMYGKTVFYVTQVDKEIHSPNYSDVVVVLVAETVNTETLAIKTADASLIAAAPELLQALQIIVATQKATIERCKLVGIVLTNENLGDHELALAAIAKATGGES